MEGYLISVSGRWIGPVKNPIEIADGWLKYGESGQGRIKAGNWKKDALKPAPRLGYRKPSAKPRLTLAPEILRDGTPRCFCSRCGGYFRTEAAFNLHQFRPTFGKSSCARDDRELRNAGLRIHKRHQIRGREILEWGK